MEKQGNEIKKRNDFHNREYKSWEKDVKILNDGWTAVTKDKKLSAQFEHTIGVTDKGYEVFTVSEKEKLI